MRRKHGTGGQKHLTSLTHMSNSPKDQTTPGDAEIVKPLKRCSLLLHRTATNVPSYAYNVLVQHSSG
jgi:hypothetical protein